MSAQNTSSAVMQQRHEPHDSLDDFPTPPWATRALLEHVILPLRDEVGFFMEPKSVWEPCANRGHMVRPLAEYFSQVHSSDIKDYAADLPPGAGNGYGLARMADGSLFKADRIVDFLWPGSEPADVAEGGVDWCAFNPPFRLAERFLRRAQGFAKEGVAVFQRTSFLEGAKRYRRLFKDNPPTVVAQFAERVILHKGALRDPSRKYWDDAAQKWRLPSTATAYCWLVWIKNWEPQPFQWIPPCRKQLERPGDYPGDHDERRSRREEGDLI